MNPRPGRVLVVDDQSDVRRVIRRSLARTRETVVEADRGEAALAAIEAAEEPFDVVLLDLSMPGLDGLQTLERLRAIAPDLPVILMSGHCLGSSGGSSEGVPRCHFLAKPFSLFELRDAIDGAIGTTELAKEPAESR